VFYKGEKCAWPDFANMDAPGSRSNDWHFRDWVRRAKLRFAGPVNALRCARTGDYVATYEDIHEDTGEVVRVVTWLRDWDAPSC
jgi:hypothetical protein